MVEKLHTDPQRKREFPQLDPRNHWVKSPKTKLYNCIGWAMNDDTRQWWPDSMGGYYWPPTLTRQETLAAFTEMVGLFGFHPTTSRALEKGFDKLALYALGSTPTHLAKQLPNGKWTSKLGDFEDIDHKLEALEGPFYGQVVQTYAKPKPR